jgi:Spy/CpxP family protein refolding chaperone
MLERISRCTLCLPLLFTLACDTGDETVEARSADEPAQVAIEAHHDHHGPPHGRDHGNRMLEHLCGEIECSDEQREAIGDLLADAKSHGSDNGPDGDARHQALADAFRGETFDAAALPQPSEGMHEAHRTEMATMIVGVHALLTPEQRETIADKIEAGDRMPLLGRHGKHHGDHEFDPAKHAEHKVERLCELVTCTEAQVEQLATIFTDALAELPPREPPKVDEAMKSKVAAAFRTETLALADVEALLDAARPAKPRPEMRELLVAVHAVLTPEQRGVLADKIAEHGPHALVGGKGKHGKKHGKGKHGKGKRGFVSEPI